ncbi:MAG: anthranilate phosphoribosyltransferase [Desulfuromonadaceae bacterium]|nr:anthranilate phosphoribosyltransferase [Desulfuromonadaceae bacterium]
MANKEERWRQFGAIVVRLTRGENISREESRDCWRQICEEEQSDLQQGAFMGALKAKPESPEEIAGAFEALYEYDTLKVEVNTPEPLIDNCGTGADTLKTINISTGAAIIGASLGLYVVRHASRAISSNCGAIDVIEALGVNVESAPEVPKQSIEKAGIGAWNAFLPKVHPRTLARVLSQVRFGSTINLIGPLLNPTKPTYKVMGVPTTAMIDIEVKTLKALNFKRAFVMHGLEEESGKGMDEISILGPTHVAELTEEGNISKYLLTPEQFGIKRARYEEIASNRDVKRDALALLRVLTGKDSGPRFEVVCLNAAPLLYLTGKADSLKDGFEMARDAVADGKAMAKLRDWVTWQNLRPEDGLPVLEKMLEQI